MVDLSFLTEFAIPVIVGICLCIGFIIKNLIPTEKINKFIPLIVGLVGLIIAIWINKAISPVIVLQGLFSGLSSTGLYELFRNLLQKISKKEE